MRSEAETDQALSRYADMVRRICFVHLKNNAEVEDIFQEVFLKYVLSDKAFESDAHEKAWLIRVAINACRDTLRSLARRKVQPLETLYGEMGSMDSEQRDVLEAVLALPQRYRDVIYLHYFEGYAAVEIANILHRSHNTVYTWLDRGRKQLRDRLGGDALA